jgi:hypothetical protein
VIGERPSYKVAELSTFAAARPLPLSTNMTRPRPQWFERTSWCKALADEHDRHTLQGRAKRAVVWDVSHVALELRRLNVPQNPGAHRHRCGLRQRSRAPLDRKH